METPGNFLDTVRFVNNKKGDAKITIKHEKSSCKSLTQDFTDEKLKSVVIKLIKNSFSSSYLSPQLYHLRLQHHKSEWQRYETEKKKNTED